MNFPKILVSNLMKICPVKAEVLREDGRTGNRTDKTKLTVAFRNFARAPNNPVLPVTSKDVRKYQLIHFNLNTSGLHSC